MDVAGDAGPGGAFAEAERDRGALLRALGPRADRYLLAYGRRRTGGRRWVASWCWPAALLGAQWAYYRRLYGTWIVAQVACAAATLVLLRLLEPVRWGWALALAGPALLVRAPLAVLGPTLVVDAALRRARRGGAAETPGGPLRAYPRVIAIVIAASIAGAILLVWLRHGGPPPPRPSPGPFGAASVAPLLLGMLLANLPSLAVVAWACRRSARRAAAAAPDPWWPPLAALAAGIAAVLAPAEVPVVQVGLALLPADAGARLAGATYLLIGPWEEALKVAALAALLLPYEALRHPADGIVAALLVGVGFGLVENLHYVALAGPPLAVGLARMATPVHLVLALFVGLGLHAALRRRAEGRRAWPPLAAGWLVAALVHGAYDHAAILLLRGAPPSATPPGDPGDLVLRALGVSSAALHALPQRPAVAEAAAAAVLALAALVAAVRRLRRPDTPAATSAAAGP